MRILLLLPFLLIGCSKKATEPNRDKVEIQQPIPTVTHTVTVVYLPGGSNSELKINLDYPTGIDSVYNYSGTGLITKTFIVSNDSIQVYGRSYDANIEYDGFTIKVDGAIIDQYNGRSLTKEFKIN